MVVSCAKERELGLEQAHSEQDSLPFAQFKELASATEAPVIGMGEITPSRPAAIGIPS